MSEYRTRRVPCLAPGCNETRSIRNVFCRKHSVKVPDSVYAAIWKHENKKKPGVYSTAFFLAVCRAIESLTHQEAQPA